MWIRFLGQEDPLEEGTATHSSILVWRIPWTEEPGGLRSRVTNCRTQLKRLSTYTQMLCSCIFKVPSAESPGGTS